VKARRSKQVFDLEQVPEELRDRVAALIPPPALAGGYVHRTIEGVPDFAYLDGAREDVENVMLVGPTGSSKTTVARAYAAHLGVPFTAVECNGAMDPGTVLGRTVTDSDTGLATWVDGDFLLVTEFGGVVLIDEINLAHSRITAAFHTLLSVARRIGVPEAGKTVRAHESLLIMAAMNDRYQGTVRLNEAMQNRFAVPLEWGYVREVEEQLIRSPRLLDMADGIRSLADIRTPVSTNSLMEFERHHARYGWAPAAMMFVNRFDASEQAGIGRALEANSGAIDAELIAIQSGASQ
jgi:MoxR-like ATPase